MTDSPLWLAWSPDGRYLFFDDSAPDSPIWRVTADGDNLTEIVSDGYLLGVVRGWESLLPPPDGEVEKLYPEITQLRRPSRPNR